LSINKLLSLSNNVTFCGVLQTMQFFEVLIKFKELKNGFFFDKISFIWQPFEMSQFHRLMAKTIESSIVLAHQEAELSQIYLLKIIFCYFFLDESSTEIKYLEPAEL
jgi:hypothetical protein